MINTNDNQPYKRNNIMPTCNRQSYNVYSKQTWSVRLESGNQGV